MKTIAHWINIGASRGFTAADGSHQRDVIELQTGPGHGPIQFIVNIPEESAWDEVVAKWVLEYGVRVDDKTDGIGFQEDWPPDVLRQFNAGTGITHEWASLK
jgi:hypothetical protein